MNNKEYLSNFKLSYELKNNCYIIILRMISEFNTHSINCTISHKKIKYDKFEVGFYKDFRGPLELIKRNIILDPHRYFHNETINCMYDIINVSYISDFGKLLLL